MSTNATKNIWFGVWLTEFLLMFIINAFTLIIFARTLQLRKRSTYLIINLTVADLLIAGISGPEALWVLKTEKRPEHGLRALHLIISDMCWIASLGNLVLISLERLHVTLYPFRHYCLVEKRIHYTIIIFSWLGALTLACVQHIIRMNDSALADRYPWIIYVALTLAVLTTSYVIIISKFIRRPHVQQLGSVMSAERKLSVTLFIVSAASILTLLPWVIIICISISSDRYLWSKFTPMKIASTFYHLNSIFNPVIYAIRLPEFRRPLKEVFCKNTSYPVRRDQPIELQAI
ncbi:unnamed protein product [Porites evermanni]|uniref:G-protein coupled receptors family 1 profile domain-containing protein n=1 Tax=Porites evermanni TaxID=104178 RepID=A0ABN8S7N7_9CNID|nr:unnamed protein product [Porites evermanni]